MQLYAFEFEFCFVSFHDFTLLFKVIFIRGGNDPISLNRTSLLFRTTVFMRVWFQIQFWYFKKN